MTNNHLNRELAPISETAWNEIQSEASRALRNFLAARKLVDFNGPKGWSHAAEATGRVAAPRAKLGDAITSVRQSRPLVELKVPFTVPRAEIDAITRGASDADLGAVVDAARTLAAAEDQAVFYGYEPAHIKGIIEDCPHEAIAIPDDYNQYPGAVAKAVNVLRSAGVDGQYGLALGPRCYIGVIEGTEKGGYPVLEHLHLIVGGPVVWAPAVDGAVVMSLRGGDFGLTVGQDVSIGYSTSNANEVELYLEESISFGNHSPEAAVSLRYL